VIQRLRRLEPEIEEAGHKIRFCRGSRTAQHREFLLALKTDPEPMHRLLGLVTDFLVDWLAWQRECFLVHRRDSAELLAWIQALALVGATRKVPEAP
jgi:hypothetical protein